MVEYHYGSPPQEPYEYRSFVSHVAPHLPKNDKVFLHEGSLKWRTNRQGIPLDLFRNICHWKSPRRFRRVRDNKAHEVHRRWQNALQSLGQRPFEDEAVGQAVNELAVLRGVGERTASALLTAWDPDEFGIMDERVFTVLGMQGDHNNYTAADYISFRARLLTLKDELPELHDCALRQIELALWHFYAVQQEGTRERPD